MPSNLPEVASRSNTEMSKLITGVSERFSFEHFVYFHICILNSDYIFLPCNGKMPPSTTFSVCSEHLA